MKPNILFLLLDSVRADKFYGNSRTSITPNLDTLVKKGTYFTQAISSSDATILSMSSYLNSLYPFRINNNRTWKIILKENNNLDILKTNGYHIFGTMPGTAMMSAMSKYCENEDNEYDAFDKTEKSTLTFPDGTPRQRKYLFDDFNNSVGKKIIDFLESNTMKEPWFYYIHSHDFKLRRLYFHMIIMVSNSGFMIFELLS